MRSELLFKINILSFEFTSPEITKVCAYRSFFPFYLSASIANLEVDNPHTIAVIIIFSFHFIGKKINGGSGCLAKSKSYKMLESGFSDSKSCALFLYNAC